MTKSSTKTTKTAAKKPVKAATIKHPNHRVWRLPAGLREAVRAYREVEALPVVELFARAIERADALATELERMGVKHDGEQAVPVRVGHTEEQLATLRAASGRCGLDQSALLVAALRLMVAEPTPTAPAKRGRKRV